MNQIYLIAPIEKSFDADIVSFEKAGSSYIEKVNENKMNALYIRRIQENIGLGSISAYLKTKDVKTKIINAPIDNISNEEIIDTIMKDNPIIVGISILYDLHVYNAMDIISKLRKRGYKNHITLGGTHISLAYERYMKTFPEIDTVLIGDGEDSFYELYNKLSNHESIEDIPGLVYRKDRECIYNRKCYLPEEISYPAPDRDTLAYLKEHNVKFTTAAVYFSRGCNNNCVYCGAPAMRKMHNKIWRPRNAKLLVDEIENLVNNFGVSYLYFCDDNFCGYGEVGKKHIMDFVHQMKERNLSVRFHAEIRADTKLTKDDFKLLKEVGLDEALIGIESGSQTCLNRWKKGAKVEHNQMMINLLRECKIDIAPAYILVDPYTTLKELEESYLFAYENQLYTYKEPWGLFNKMIVYPGSMLEKMINDDGISKQYEAKEYTLTDADQKGLNEVCRNISSIKYEIQSDEVRILWSVLIKSVDRISDLAGNIIPAWTGKNSSRENIRKISKLSKWRRNLGLLLMSMLEESIECAKNCDSTMLEDSLAVKLNSISEEYDNKYLGTTMDDFLAEN